MLNVELLSADFALVSKTIRTHATKSDLPPGGPRGAAVGQILEIDKKKWIVVAAVALQTESEARAAGMAFASA
jgi:hypothetical protein